MCSGECTPVQYTVGSVYMYCIQWGVYTCAVGSVHLYSGECTPVQWGVYTYTVGSVHLYSGDCTHIQRGVSSYTVGGVLIYSGECTPVQWECTHAEHDVGTCQKTS